MGHGRWFWVGEDAWYGQLVVHLFEIILRAESRELIANQIASKRPNNYYFHITSQSSLHIRLSISYKSTIQPVILRLQGAKLFYSSIDLNEMHMVSEWTQVAQ